jgi:hypothetical protein
LFESQTKNSKIFIFSLKKVELPSKTSKSSSIPFFSYFSTWLLFIQRSPTFFRSLGKGTALLLEKNGGSIWFLKKPKKLIGKEKKRDFS